MKKQSKTKTPEANDSVRSFAQSFELMTVRLASSNAKIALRAGSRPTKLDLKVECAVGVSTEEQALTSNISCEASSYYEDADSEPAILIRCEYQVIYKFLGGDFPSTEDLEAGNDDVTNSAMLIAWPFVRHHLFWVSSQMGIPPFTLPLFRTEAAPGRVGKIRSSSRSEKVNARRKSE